MLVVSGHLRIDPNNLEIAKKAMEEVMTETHKEAGNISYVFTHTLDEPGHFRIFEEWDSQDALDAHMKAPHMAVFGKAMGGFGVTEILIKRYQVGAVDTLLEKGS